MKSHIKTLVSRFRRLPDETRLCLWVASGCFVFGGLGSAARYYIGGYTGLSALLLAGCLYLVMAVLSRSRSRRRPRQPPDDRSGPGKSDDQPGGAVLRTRTTQVAG